MVGWFVRAKGILGDDVGEFFRIDFGEAVVTLFPRYGMVLVKSLPVWEGNFGVVVLLVFCFC
jgi:hypothetical protein